jgi:hypothetical protein
MGYDCSPSSALLALGLRKHSLPFDWLVSSIIAIERCFQDNFQNFHGGLAYFVDPTRATNGTYLQDCYGLRFLHDYPMNGERIAENWHESFSQVYEKYQRRIKRFLEVVHDRTKPIVILCRYNPVDTVALKGLFKTYFGREDVKIITASWGVSDDPDITVVSPESRGNWNDTEIWREAMDKVVPGWTPVENPHAEI